MELQTATHRSQMYAGGAVSGPEINFATASCLFWQNEQRRTSEGCMNPPDAHDRSARASTLNARVAMAVLVFSLTGGALAQTPAPQKITINYATRTGTSWP